MRVVSLGCRTDLALLVAGGSEVEDRGDHLVVRSPHNPTHWWGNFLLLERAPAAADAARWLERFAATFPDAGHVAFSVDGTHGRVSDLDPWAAAGLVVEAQAVMTASGVRTTRRRSDAVCRALVSDEDWAQSVELRVRCSDGREEPAAFRTYATAQAQTRRQLVDAGHGGWFGAFDDDRLVSQLGLFVAGPGLARFQSVETDPDFRRRGLAGTLIAHAVERVGDRADARHGGRPRVRRDRPLPVARLRRGRVAAAGGAATRLARVSGRRRTSRRLLTEPLASTGLGQNRVAVHTVFGLSTATFASQNCRRSGLGSWHGNDEQHHDDDRSRPAPAARRRARRRPRSTPSDAEALQGQIAVVTPQVSRLQGWLSAAAGRLDELTAGACRTADTGRPRTVAGWLAEVQHATAGWPGRSCGRPGCCARCRWWSTRSWTGCSPRRRRRS